MEEIKKTEATQHFEMYKRGRLITLRQGGRSERSYEK